MATAIKYEIRKIQDIKFNNFIEIEALKPMYYRGSTSILTVEDGSAKLKGDHGFDFFTYFNSLAIGKWRKYTNGISYYLVLSVKGTFDLDLFGHLPEENGHQKEWGGHFSYDLKQKKQIVIPIPKTMQSDIVSFSISTNSDVYVYDSYYATEIDEDHIKKLEINIVTEFFSESKILNKNVDLLTEDIFDDSAYKKSFSWTIYDKEKILNNSDFSGKIHLVQSKDKFKKAVTKGTHVIVADEAAIFSSDSFKRVYEFLSIIKDEYEDCDLIGAALKAELQNIQCAYTFSDDYEEEYCSYLDTIPEAVNTDLCVWSNIIDNEMPDEEIHNRFFPGFFYCTPIESYLKNSSDKDDDSTLGKSLLKNCSENIRLSGVCSWVLGIGRKIEKSFRKKLVKVHGLVLSQRIEIEVTRNMYYRSNSSITYDKNKLGVLPENDNYDFFTYFNSFSLEKWKKYTYIDNVFLVIDAKGSFDIDLFGHYKNNNGYQKELLGRYSFDNRNREKVIIAFPQGVQSHILGFAIFTRSELHVYDAYYASDIDAKLVKKPQISMVTTTFKKENYVRKNIELLKSGLLSNKEYRDSFKWYIIDNGKTLDVATESSEKIQIIPNKNVGGAGGFAKGMIEALSTKEKPTHILLMDDDVTFIPESFKRLCSLLSIIRNEYSDRFISGAMLKMGQPNIQHEDTGRLNEMGYHEAVKPNYDLNLWNHLLDNEELRENVDYQYAAWWFCCIPTTVASFDNLPLPVFVRGDDVEYSLRNKAKFITMNGICIWHEGFEGKFSAALEYYQVNRNELAVRALHPELSDVDTFGHIRMLFWEEMYKFNYKGASLLLDAIEDYMKGPEFFKTLDGEQCMKDKKKLDNVTKPLSPEIRAKVDFETLYELKPLNDSEKKIYHMTKNGQEGKSVEAAAGRTGVIPYGWGYFPNKMCLVSKIIAVDPSNDSYVIYTKSRAKYNELKKRYEEIIYKYDNEHERIEQEYRDSAKDLTGKAFWDKYLA